MWLIKKLIGEVSWSFWAKGDGENGNLSSVLDVPYIPDMYINGEQVIKKGEWKHIVMVWGGKGKSTKIYVQDLANFDKKLTEQDAVSLAEINEKR